VVAVAACAAVGFDYATLRFLWLPVAIAPGQYRTGYFEEPEGIPSLILDDSQHISGVEPDLGLDRKGTLKLYPGRSIGLPLLEDAEYRVYVDNQHWAPFCVFGSLEALADQADRHGPFRLVGGRTLGFQDGQLSAANWTILRSWHADQSSLMTLRERCAGTEPAVKLIVRQRQGRPDIRYGSCFFRLNSPADVMVVLAGPASMSIEKAGGWATERTVRSGQLLFAASLGTLQFATAAVTVGVVAAAFLAASLFGIATASPESGIVGFAVLLFVGCVAAGIRMIRAAGHPASTPKVVLGALLLLAPIVSLILPFVPARFLPDEQPVGAPARCLLVGYSAMRGASLRQSGDPGSPVSQAGAWEGLKRSATCSGSVERRARGAGRFSWVRDTLCGAAPGVVPGGEVVFFGGSNDDFLWAGFQATRLSQLARLARYAYAPPGTSEWLQIAAAVEESSLGALQAQTDALSEALRCVTRQQARFRYFHDFLVWDLAQPRSDARRRMLSARAETVRSGGGDFVDVLDQVRDEAGLWWFNDYIHPSEIAHRRIGELMAREIDHHRSQ
jgi:hypothetical protein